MNLKRRINRLESQMTSPEDLTAEVEGWARLWAEARQGKKVQILQEDREAAGLFIQSCRSMGEPPSMVAMLKLA